MRTGATLAVVLLVASGLVPALGSAGAWSSSHDLRIDIDRTIDGADTFMFSVRIEPGAGGPDHFNIANGSFFEVTGHYPAGGNGSSGRQDASGLIGVVAYNTGIDCPPRETNNVDPCFMSASGVSLKDAWDTRVDAGAFTYETGGDSFRWKKANGGVIWDQERRFEAPPGADQLTVRFFVSIPGAERIDVQAHLHSPQDISVHSTVANAGGFQSTGEDFDPAAGVDTAPASALVAGRDTVDLSTDGDRMFAAFGPSWNGATAAGFVGVRHNTAAASNIVYEDPSGDRFGGTAVGAFGFHGIFLPGVKEQGTHAFEINAHAGVGPQDVYLIGYKGPTG